MSESTRDRIVDSARQLFWEQGYEATSLAGISEASGARLGSIYYFFKTKEQILEAVLDHYEGQLSAWLVDPVFERTEDPVERIFGVVDTYRTFLIKTHFTLGCPVGGLALEIPEEYHAARERIARIFASLSGTLEACAREAVPSDPSAAAEGGAPDHPASVAALVMTVIEGGIVQARALRSIEPFDRSVECLRDYLALLGERESVG